MELNKIHNIDCFEGMALLDDNSIDYHFTSPPYGRKRNDKYKFYDDTVDWFELINNTIKESIRILKDDGFLFLNIQKNYYNKKDYYKILGLWSDYIVETIVWGKNNPMPASGLNITNSYEVFIVISPSKKPLKSKNTYTKNMFITNVNSNNKYKKEHKAVMNLEASNYIFSNFIKKDALVLDCFAGVGTTFVSCLKNNNSFIGYELSEEYAEIGNKRIEDMEIVVDNN